MPNDFLNDKDLLDNATYCFGLLVTKGKVSVDDCLYFANNMNHYMTQLNAFAQKLDARVFKDVDYLYLVPLSYRSPLHLSPSEVRRQYFSSLPETNTQCVFVANFVILILVGMFYENGIDDPRNFVPEAEWMAQCNIDFQYIEAHRKEYEADEAQKGPNWTSLLDFWDSMNETIDDVDSKLERKTKRWFLQTVLKMLIDSDFARIGGDYEIELTRKGHCVIREFLENEDLHQNILNQIDDLKQRAILVEEED